jgi:hypothetical protein
MEIQALRCDKTAVSVAQTVRLFKKRTCIFSSLRLGFSEAVVLEDKVGRGGGEEKKY